MNRIAHIINPTKVKEKSDLEIAQPISLESIRRARLFADSDMAIKLYATHFEDEAINLNTAFTTLSHLTRSVLDLDPNLKRRQLPLIGDILSKTKEMDEFDYLIFSNMDIGLMPSFYLSVQQHIQQGHDAIVINRRRLSKKYSSVDQLPEIYADLGLSHPGFDCFVIKKDLLPKFILDTICVGIPFLEASLVHNIIAFSARPKWVMDAHLTFHIGLDVLSDKRLKDPFYWHNRKVYFEKIHPRLKPHLKLQNYPYSMLPWYKRMLKWILNPSLFSKDLAELETQSFRTRLNEWRWRLLQR